MNSLTPKSSPAKRAIIEEDPWLEPYQQDVEDRYQRYAKALSDIENHGGGLLQFSNAHRYYGINFDMVRNGWYYREWAPQAHQLFLLGDFNGWNRQTHPLSRNEMGDWEIFLPFNEYKSSFCHESKIKVHVLSAKGGQDRVPAYITRVVQDPVTYDFSGQLWFPEQAYTWQHPQPKTPADLIIYECHVGMGQEKEGIGTYLEFAELVLPRIHKAGYTAIQMMAIMEHPYYGSFGYHVSSFFAPCSRFGTPEELKYLIDKAHSLGIAVIMDIVHSHAVKNLAEGLNEFDGTDYQYFHSGGKGNHDGWDSKLFDYGKWEVKRFLLSNVRYWLEEFHFDGYRFDGVTSMLYAHHGLTSFDHYDKYFKSDVEWDAVIYLQLANQLIRTLNPEALSIAEDVSGMPGLSRLPEEGGLGFHYRLGMGIPDFWIKILKHKSDEEWDIHELWHTLVNRRYKEKTIAYAESHDQAMVGDKTLAFWLMDKEMYFHMAKGHESLIIDRGIALHKMIRFFTITLGGEAYLNFMGNEFGHPEWIDFPREGNGWSYKYARRQWSLADQDFLKYHYLSDFDRAMVTLVRAYHLLNSLPAAQLNMDTTNQVIIFERNNLLFLFNFSPTNSIFGYRFRPPKTGKYKIILNSDDKEYGGFGRIDNTMEYATDDLKALTLYLTNRTALVLKKVD